MFSNLFLIPNKLEQLEFKLEKIIGIVQEKLEKKSTDQKKTLENSILNI